MALLELTSLSPKRRSLSQPYSGQTKVYGDADPLPFTYTFAPALVGTDVFSGALDRAAGEDVGSYAIGQGTLTLSGNYTLAYVGADFTITKKTITVTANSGQTKVYGDADPRHSHIHLHLHLLAPMYSADLDRAAGEDVGSYAIGQGTLTLSGNYTMAYVGADFTITKKTITVTG